MKTEKFRFFISCAPGIEPILERETRQLGLLPLSHIPHQSTSPNPFSGEEPGGLLFEGYATHVMQSNLHLRTAGRVIVRLGEFYASAFSELRKKAARLEWEKFLSPGQAVNIRAVCHKSKLYHSDAVAERVLGAINDHFSIANAQQKNSLQDAQGQMVLVRMVNDQCTISIDSSGEPLHRRGYRLAVAKAPLRETLAAALLIASGWDGSSPLVDPFCGSGTIPIEAALLARRIPPGIARDFAFMKWPAFPKDEWQTMLSKAQSEILPLRTSIYGYDRDKGAIEMSAANASRAGQKSEISFAQQPVSSLKPAGTPGWIITNPPYGLRVSGSKDLRDLYARFGSILRDEFIAWNAGILCSDPKLTGQLGIGEPFAQLRFSNGGIPVQYSMFEIKSR